MAKELPDQQEPKEDVFTLFGFIKDITGEDDKEEKIDLMTFMNAIYKRRKLDDRMRMALNTATYSKFTLNRFFCTPNYFKLINELNLFNDGVSNEMHLDCLMSIKKYEPFLRFNFKKSAENEELEAIKFYYNTREDNAKRLLQLLNNHPEHLDRIKEKYKHHCLMTKKTAGKTK